ncbi:MAG: hypothetical protein ACN4GR_16600 [Arenicellales bacterium]
MTDKKSSESRRRLLKSISTGGGAIVVGKSLPESWSRPVVDSVMLPAHAQASTAPNPFSCIGQSASTNELSSRLDSVWITFNGDSICSVAAFNNSLIVNEDAAIIVRTAPAVYGGTFFFGRGDNWAGLAAESFRPPATYTRRVTRTSGAAINPDKVYDVTFTFTANTGVGPAFILSLTLDGIVEVV